MTDRLTYRREANLVQTKLTKRLTEEEAPAKVYTKKAKRLAKKLERTKG